MAHKNRISTQDAVSAVRRACVLSGDLRHPSYKDSVSPLAGMCYIASEAVQFLLGKEWKPEVVKVAAAVHWYLRHRKTGEVLDVTADQFAQPVPYHLGRGCGFLTKNPSRRTMELLRRLERSKDEGLRRPMGQESKRSTEGRNVVARD